MPHLRNTVFSTQTQGDTIIKLVLDCHCILSHHRTYTVIVGCRHVLYREVGLLRITQIKSKLRTGIHEDVQSSCLPTPCQMRKDWHLNIVDGTLVSHRFFGFGDNHRIILLIQDILFPSCLRIVYLGIDRTDGLEIFLTGISHRETARQSAVLLLLYLGCESYATHHIAPIKTDGEIITMLSYLCRNWNSEDEHQNQQPNISIHYQL